MPSSACDWSSDVCSSDRSEEHTSELQSRSDLVCRLLLEKKKKNSKLPLQHFDTTCFKKAVLSRNPSLIVPHAPGSNFYPRVLPALRPKIAARCGTSTVR